jgi:hypothetical protein
MTELQMTTPAREAFYRAQHVAEMEGKCVAVFNPHGKPVEELPAIYAFPNSTEPGWIASYAMAEDGTCLGSHICSHEAYIPHDLGVLEGTREDRHETYQSHYPDGYRMECLLPASLRDI